jgi:hypothetical protein
MIKVFHTPGAFGNYLAFLIDSKNKGKIISDPFTESGSSHHRKKITISHDIVLSDNYVQFKNCTDRDIGIYWPDEYFFYILHSAYGRTNNGQYGGCGVKALQNNTWQWYTNHQAHVYNGNDLAYFLDNLKTFYGFDCNEHNQVVPRIVLQHCYFFYFTKYFENKLYIKNKQIKENDTIKKVSIEVILDYEKIKSFLGIDFDFTDTHSAFIEKNQSLKAYHQQLIITDAVKNKKAIEIDDLDVITEAGILFALEKHYYDIPFHNLDFDFKNTTQLIEYVQHFPQYMKKPNNLFLEHWKTYNVK